MKTFTKAERKIRRAKVYGARAVWWYVGAALTEFYIETKEPAILRVKVGTRYLRNALREMDRELEEEKVKAGKSTTPSLKGGGFARKTK